MPFAFGDDNSDRKNEPVVVPIIIGLNLIVFLLQLLDFERSIMAWSLIPYEVTNNVDLVGPMQVTAKDKIEEITHRHAPLGPYFSFLSSMFLHGGYGHILGNMWYLWLFGDQIEDRLGRWKFLAFYLICGLVAGIGYVICYPSSTIPTLGASGAIAGVMGAYLALYPQKKVNVVFLYTAWEWPAWLFHGSWFLMQTIGQFGILADGVAYLAHVAGFAAGVVGILAHEEWMRRRGAPKRKKRSYRRKREPVSEP